MTQQVHLQQIKFSEESPEEHRRSFQGRSTQVLNDEHRSTHRAAELLREIKSDTIGKSWTLEDLKRAHDAIVEELESRMDYDHNTPFQLSHNQTSGKSPAEKDLTMSQPYRHFEQIWSDWAKERICEVVAVEPDLDGIPVEVSRDEKIASVIPQAEVDSQTDARIGDWTSKAEREIFGIGEPFRLTGTYVEEDGKGRVYVNDILERNGQSLQESSWFERQNVLRNLGIDNYGYLRRVKPTQVMDRPGLSKAIKESEAFPGSSGALMREAHATDPAAAVRFRRGHAQSEEAAISQSLIGELQFAEAERTWEVITIQAGFSLNDGMFGAFYFPPEVLEEHASLFENVPVHAFSFERCDPASGTCSLVDDHLPPEVSLAVKEGRLPHPTKEIVGFLQDARYDENREAIVAQMKMVEDAAWLDDLLVLAAENHAESSQIFGLSIDVIGTPIEGMAEGQPATIISDIGEVAVWVDVVSHPAAGGVFILNQSGHKHEWQQIESENPSASSQPCTCGHHQDRGGDQGSSDLEAAIRTLDVDDDIKEDLIGLAASRSDGSADNPQSPNPMEEPIMAKEKQQLQPDESQEQAAETSTMTKEDVQSMIEEATAKMREELTPQQSQESEAETDAEEAQPSAEAADPEEGPESETTSETDPELLKKLEELEQKNQDLSQKLEVQRTAASIREKLEEADVAPAVASTVLAQSQGQAMSDEEMDKLIKGEQERFDTYVAESERLKNVTGNAPEEADTERDEEAIQESAKRARTARNGLGMSRFNPPASEEE